MHILVLNPNTTAAMTEKIARSARSVVAQGSVIEAVTSSMGPPSIEGYYDEAFAVPGLIAALLAHESKADGAVIACFDDTGLDAARSATAIPVVGICEAALHVAALLAHRFNVVTTLARSIPPIEALAARYGVAARCTVRAAGVSVLALDDRASGALAKIESEITRAREDDHAEAIVLGCAGMTDLAAPLASKFGMPVIDGVTAAVKLVEAVVGLGLVTSKSGGYAPPLAKAYGGAMAQFAPKAG